MQALRRRSSSSSEDDRPALSGSGSSSSDGNEDDDSPLPDRSEAAAALMRWAKAAPPRSPDSSEELVRKAAASKRAKSSTKDSSDDMDRREARKRVTKPLRRRGSSDDMDRRVMNARAVSEASDASEMSEEPPPQDDAKRSNKSEVATLLNQGSAAASLSAAAEAMQEAEAAQADKEAQGPPLEVEAENLREMLAERQDQLAQEKSGPKREEIEKDVAILTGWLRSKERELVERDKMQLRERLKGFELEAKKVQEQQEAARKAQEIAKQAEADKQAAAEPPAKPSNGTATGSTAEASKAVDAVTLPPVGGRVPPCDLPLWCVIPNPDDIVTHVEILRCAKSDSSSTRRLLLGRRSWALLGRRQQPPVSGPDPCIGLASPRASRSHALLLRNWQGQIFLLDLGSPNGSFLGDKKLPAKKALRVEGC